jgi:hypothetical protein
MFSGLVRKAIVNPRGKMGRTKLHHSFQFGCTQFAEVNKRHEKTQMTNCMK